MKIPTALEKSQQIRKFDRRLKREKSMAKLAKKEGFNFAKGSGKKNKKAGRRKKV